MFAPAQAKMMGWIWHGGYQSHFVTPDGVHIPTCNVYPGAATKEMMMMAYHKQIEIDLRFKAQHIEFGFTGKLTPQSEWESFFNVDL
jgi:hypothetical protein